MGNGVCCAAFDEAGPSEEVTALASALPELQSDELSKHADAADVCKQGSLTNGGERTDHCGNTAAAGAQMLFQRGQASLRTVTFTCRPLGLDLTRTMPMNVKRVFPGSQADQLGVVAGDVLLEVGGLEVNGKPLEDATVILQKSVKLLPMSSE